MDERPDPHGLAPSGTAPSGFAPSGIDAFPLEEDDPALAPLRVLVGDPDAHTTELLSHILGGRGYEVVTAATGAGTLALLDAQDVDVVLLAWAFPDATGLQILRQVRARHAMPDLPVVLMSSRSESQEIVRAFDRGANDVIAKPLDPDVTLVRVHNLVALRRARLELRQLAMVDALTGIFNRRYIMEQVGAQLSQARRHRRRLSFCLCDIDWFKTVNDTYGHHAGDAALVAFARLLRERLRRSDVVGRFGGDELCILFPETGAADALVAVENVRTTLAALALRAQDGTPYGITGSFGIAELGPEISEPSTLLSCADQALYRAKAGGRNRSVIYRPSAAPPLVALASSA